MQSKSFLFFLCFYCVYSVSFAQELHFQNFTQPKKNNNHSFDTFTNFRVKDGLPSNNITHITQDPQGYIWLATSEGISRYDGINFKNFTKKNGLNTYFVSTLLPVSDSLLIGSTRNIFIRHQNRFTALDSKRVRCFTKVDSTIFVGTDKGIYKLKDNYVAPLRTNFQIDLNLINAIAFDGKNYWVATQKALWQLDDLKTPKKITKMGKGNYTSLLPSGNVMITTTYRSGIHIFNGDKVTQIPTTTKNIVGIKKILNAYWIFSITDGIEIRDTNFYFKRKLNKYNVLPSNHITDVFEDTQKNVWIASNNKGVFQWKNEDYQKSNIPQISFENIEVLYQPVDSININTYANTFHLPAKSNHLAFSFKTIDLNAPKTILYRYKLNENYSPWSRKNYVNFANLKPGDYTFYVQSKIANNKESTPIKFQFYIDKPFYQKNWFRIVAFTLLVVALGSIIYAQIRKIKRKNEATIEALELKNHLLTLEQKALQLQMNPHFIFNVLNGIKAMGNSGNLKELNSTIAKFSKLLRSMLTNSRKEEISLSEEIETLKNYFDLELQMSPRAFTYTINNKLKLDAEEVLIPPMLIQPFVENSIKHGIKHMENGKIEITFFEFHNYVHCEVIDNGIGIFESKRKNTHKTHDSLALQVTEDRIKTLSSLSEIKVKELKDKGKVIGTKIWFKIPLKTDF